MSRRLLLLGLTAMTLAACSNPLQGTGGSPSSSASASPSPSATPTPVPSPTLINGRIVVSALDDTGGTMVASILFPASGSACGASSGKYDSCPVTDGLAARLDANPLKQAEPLCRCQNTWQSRSVTTDPLPPDNPGATAHVVLNFGSASEKLDITVLRTQGGWFASDTSCTGQDPQATSIYAASPAPCS